MLSQYLLIAVITAATVRTGKSVDKFQHFVASSDPLYWVPSIKHEIDKKLNAITDLFKAFLGNSSVNTVNVQQWEMWLSGRILLRVARQLRTNEDAG
jgi:hypothetical protein